MPNQHPMSAWQQCKVIAEAAISREPEVSTRAAVLEQLAMEGPQGAKLAARLAVADGPIKGEPDDLPLLFRLLATASSQDGRTLRTGRR
jgi:hypothetical protein